MVKTGDETKKPEKHSNNIGSYNRDRSRRMGSVNKYLKIAKDAVIEPEDRIDDKIMDRISHLKEEDKKEILDDNFLEFLKNSNSKPYQFEQKVREHPGLFAFVSILTMGVLAVLAYIVNLIVKEEAK